MTYSKNDPIQKAFLENPFLYVAKGYHHFSSVKNPWLKRLLMYQNGIIVFRSCHQLVKDVLLGIVAKAMEVLVFPTLA